MLLFCRHSQNPLKFQRRIVIFKTFFARKTVSFIFDLLNVDAVNMACFCHEVLWFLVELDIFSFEHVLDGFLSFEDLLVAYTFVGAYLFLFNIVVSDPGEHKLL